GKEKPVSSLIPLPMTEPEKSDARNYEPGQVVQFRQHRKGVRAGSRWTVLSASRKGLQLEQETGDKTDLDLTKTDDFEVYRKADLPLAKGDLIRITRNGRDAKEKSISNGQLLHVETIDKKGRIVCRTFAGKAGYILPANFGHL